MACVTADMSSSSVPGVRAGLLSLELCWGRARLHGRARGGWGYYEKAVNISLP